MTPEHDHAPEDDIQQALDSAHKLDEAPREPDLRIESPADTLVHAGSCPHMGMMKLWFTRLGLKAERYPWQTTLALLLTIGCGWLCVYFGWTVLAALTLWGVTTDD